MCTKNNKAAIYIHWPFCETKCPYCDFNSHAHKGRIEEQAYIDAIATELVHLRHYLGSRKKITSIFFGGGTPSLMSGATVARILKNVKKEFNVTNNAEITLEVNPSSAEVEKFQAYREAGVNRLSIGVQSFSEEGLKFLGRTHNVEAAHNAIKAAKKYFDNFSIDLIYARPDQTIESWQQELEAALQYGMPHISLYELTIEEGTKFANLVRRGKMKTMDDTNAARLYEFTQKFMRKAGLPAYEVSNHAKPGYECRHNLNYWLGGDYLGAGPGAHSRIFFPGVMGRLNVINKKDPDAWIKHVKLTGTGIEDLNLLTWKEQAEELLVNSTRIKKGIDQWRYSMLTQRTLNSEVVEELQNLKLLRRTLSKHSRYLAITAKGLMFSDYLASRLLTTN